MIPGRTKGSLTRFFRDQGAWWCQQVEIVVSDGSRSYQAAIAQYLPDARHVLDRFHVVRWFTEGLTWYGGRYNAAHQSSGPQHTNRTCSEPVSLCCAGRIISAMPTGSTWIGCSTPIHVSAPRGTRSRSSTRSTKPTTSTGLMRRWEVRPSLRQRPDPRIPRDRGHDHRLGGRDPGLPHQQTSIERTPRRAQQLEAARFRGIGAGLVCGEARRSVGTAYKRLLHARAYRECAGDRYDHESLSVDLASAYRIGDLINVELTDLDEVLAAVADRPGGRDAGFQDAVQLPPSHWHRGRLPLARRGVHTVAGDESQQVTSVSSRWMLGVVMLR